MAEAFSDVFANVQDFGLGVGADDTIGLQNLIGTGRPLLFPTGVYRLSSVLNFNQANQTSLFAAGAILQLEGLGYVKITGVNQTFRGLRIEVAAEDSGSSAAQSESATGTKTSSPTKTGDGRVAATGDTQSVSPGSATATNETLASVSLTSATLAPRLGFSQEDSGVRLNLRTTRIEPVSTRTSSSRARSARSSPSVSSSSHSPLLDIRTADDLVLFDLRVTGSAVSGTLVSVGHAERVTVFGGLLQGADRTKGIGILHQASSVGAAGPSRFAAYGVEIKTVQNAVVLGCATNTPVFQSCNFHDCEYSGVVVANLTAHRSGKNIIGTAHVRNLNLLACHVKNASQYVRVLTDTTITGGSVSGCRFGQFTSGEDSARVFLVEGRTDGLIVSGCCHSSEEDPAGAFVWEIMEDADVNATQDLMNSWDDTAIATGAGADQLVVFTTDVDGGLEVTADALSLDSDWVALTSEGEAPTTTGGRFEYA